MTTPARRQYLEIKAQHPDSLLMYQVGDFFEFFDDDARVAASALQIVLTSRSYGPDERVPLAGVPVHALDTYVGRLVAQGYSVAICEQVEPPGRGLVRREVTRVLSPGTVAEPGLLPARQDSYLAAVAFVRRGSKWVTGLASIEASTGAFAATQWDAAHMPDALRAELQRLQPAEVLVVEQRADDSPAGHSSWGEGFHLTACPAHYFDTESASIRLRRHFGTPTLEAFGCANLPAATSAAGAILAYLARMNPALLRLVSGLTTYTTSEYVEVDGRTWSALEVVEPAGGAANGPTLLRSLDATHTPMGARLLRRTLLHPLRDRTALEAHLDAVAALHANPAARQATGRILDGLPDLERLVGRILQEKAQPNELRALAAALERVPALRAALAACPQGGLADVYNRLDACAEVARLIADALAPVDDESGRVLRRGYNAELDTLVDSVSDSRQWIAGLEAQERQRTGIKSLHVTYNKVFGYSIEVSRSGVGKVPPDYMRKQTIATGERFVTPELKEHEARLAQAEERIQALEHELYVDLLRLVSAHHARLRATAGAIAQVDVWLALAEVAALRRYVRPELCDDLALDIRAGRHPVVENTLDGHAFIANDTRLGVVSADEDLASMSRMLVLTGPNMAGKSTYLRQVAHIVLLAQIGSFVPADYARIGLLDRLFARVGADDDLARGISTFMREMTETAYILRHATERSLIVLDEVGRGTSTRDGLAIARAVAEYLHDRIGARALFATHFHELADLAETLPGVRLAAMQVEERDGHLVFLHRLRPGHTDDSYGIHVARMAGVPESITTRAASIAGLRSAASVTESPSGYTAAGRDEQPSEDGNEPRMRGEMGEGPSQACNGHTAGSSERAIEASAGVPPSTVADDSRAPANGDMAAPMREMLLGLASLNVACMTPMEAINVLFSLHQRAAATLRATTRAEMSLLPDRADHA